MIKEELKNYLRENLKLKEIVTGDNWYGETKIALVLEGEVISTVTIDSFQDD